MRLAVLALAAAACQPRAGHSSCTVPIARGELVVTEVFAQPTQGTAEWIEIYSAADHELELSGLEITHARPDGSEAKSHVIDALAIAPGQYVTLAAVAAPFADATYGGDLGTLFNTGGGKLTLACGETEIDAARYDEIRGGHSRELTAATRPDAQLNDDLASWCEGDATEFSPGNFGTPGEDNDCVPLGAGRCDDQGTARDIVPPREGEVVITELMPDPTQVPDATGEWLELEARAAVDLNGVGLDRAGDATPATTLGGAACLHLEPGDRAVLAKTSDPTTNGGLTAVAATFPFALVAGPGDVRLLAGATIVDAVTWPRSTPGRALQLDPGAIDAIANDDPSNFCDAIEPYGVGDLGTPGAANNACPRIPPAGMCDDGGGFRAIVPPGPGALVITEVMPNPRIEPGEEWFEITNLGDAPFDLNELGLDRAGDSRAPDVVRAAACKPLAPGAYAVFARSADPATNAMLPEVDATFGFAMINSGGDVQVLAGETVLDSVTWASSTDGVSSQVRPGSVTTTANDAAANFCPAVTPYGDGTNLGTPGAANACP